MFSSRNEETPGPAISLMFDKRLRVAGEVLEGEVHINFPSLMKDKVEEVHIKLRGSIYTYIARKRGDHRNNRHNETQRIQLIHDTISLWQQGNDVYPPPDSHILRLPFRFTLPPNLPPSCEFNGYQKSGTIGYFVQVVGKRDMLHLDKRVLIAFPVVQRDSEGAQLREAFLAGWQGPWKTLGGQRDIRRGIWGEYSNAKISLVMPDVEALPILTPIPIILNIVTLSKLGKQDDWPSDKPIFPAPPSTPELLDFRIQRRVHLSAYQISATSADHFVSYVGGLGPGLSEVAYKNVQIEVPDKVWIPSLDRDEKTQRGQWKQQVTFKSFIRFTSPPSFGAMTMGVTYSLRLTVDFPGIGNGLQFDFPVVLKSCLGPLPEGQQAVAWDGPPPELDLPPAYFEATGWHHNEEKE
ncbi:hypothetical protein BDY19DRAFT_953036 [Irpex rosettiformis]|uniref:Uncharacterized protein n=1 Tax=Irpex rosettiformis TaxID=378272 RepID=A0ACB8U088_9APHY|nr:hypothetical protein BDY19DRAFT_953036 [Irpex rosettiformis]